jgi:hypothetical protein
MVLDGLSDFSHMLPDVLYPILKDLSRSEVIVIRYSPIAGPIRRSRTYELRHGQR